MVVGEPVAFADVGFIIAVAAMRLYLHKVVAIVSRYYAAVDAVGRHLTVAARTP